MISLNSLNENTCEIPLLDVSCLAEGQNIECLAYVQSCNVKSNRLGQPFVTFYLKDRNAIVIAARLFDAGENAKFAQAFARHPVHLFAQVQIYNGSYSLIINGDSGISIYNGTFDYTRFIGQYEVDLSGAENIYTQVMGEAMPSELYVNLSVDFLGSGKVGAFAKIYDMALASISFIDNVPGINMTELYKVFFCVMHKYFLILERYNKIGPLERLKLYEEYSTVHFDANLDLQIVDTLRGLVENTKPLHLYSHIINGAVNQANKTLQLIENNSVLVPGTKMSLFLTDLFGERAIGGVDLFKY